MLRVRLSGRAERDVDDIFDWIANHSHDGALRWYEAFREAMRKLPERSETCREAPESLALGTPVREVFFKTRRGRNYRALFVTRGEVIHVIGIRSGGQEIAAAEDVDLPN